jgi:hypothetical protein
MGKSELNGGNFSIKVMVRFGLCNGRGLRAMASKF